MNRKPAPGPYVQFSAATRCFDWPARHGFDWFCSALDKVLSERRPGAPTNWLEYERFQREVLSSPNLSDAQRCALMRDGIAAFTHRPMSPGAPETLRVDAPAAGRPLLARFESWRRKQ